MKFEVDENLPIEVARLLQEAGHDASTVLEKGLDGGQVLNLEFRQFLGATPYERSQNRKGYRNGYYKGGTAHTMRAAGSQGALFDGDL